MKNKKQMKKRDKGLFPHPDEVIISVDPEIQPVIPVVDPPVQPVIPVIDPEDNS